jgi:para-nitrobenzyl esterase
LYGWTAERLVRKQTALGEQAFLYFFDHGYPAEENAGLHAFHASELPFVFGNFDGTPPLWPKVPSTPKEIGLLNAMIGYWTSFARTGHPQAANEPEWPAFGSMLGSGGAYLAFTDAPRRSSGLLPGMYEFNEQVVCRSRISGDIAWNWNVGLASPKIPSGTSGCKAP